MRARFLSRFPDRPWCTAALALLLAAFLLGSCTPGRHLTESTVTAPAASSWTESPPLPLPEALKAKLEKYRRSAWIPEVRKGDCGARDSKFSGTAALLPGESWPCCEHCRKPMQLFVQLNIATLPVKFRKESGLSQGILQMFYCTNLKGECEYTQAVKKSGLRIKLLRIIEPDKIAASPSPIPEGQYPPMAITGWRQVDDYPHPEDLAGEGVKLQGDEEEAYEKARVTHEGEKLGGWPYWVQGKEYPPCPDCRKPMRFIFQIDSDKNIPYMWGDMGMGHITWCPVHRDRLQFNWACY